MSDDIVVVDSGEVYETQESSIIAKDEADRAEKWGKLAEERADIAASASFEAIKSKDEAAQYAATTKSNLDYVNSLLNSSSFKAVANDMLATPSAIKTALQNANNAAADAENAAESATLANDSAGDAAHWADDSRIWAVGSDTEVNQLAPNQGKHSSKTYADLAGNEADRAQQEADRAKQYVDIGELADKITNCITEIPQDIKLELNNGTLTLAQGCKGYMGDGTVRTTTGTPTLKNTGSAQMFLHITSGGTGLYAGYMTGGTVSERPSSPINYASYYNTSTQKCEYYNGSTWFEISLPIAIVTRGEDGFTSIDQVFNGFGYIGSTIFALPGVKGLIPNGRNADGSLRNTETTANRVLIYTNTDIVTGNYYIQFNGSFISRAYANPTAWRYDEERNIILWNNTTKQEVLFAGNLVLSSGRVESLTPKTAFHALDYNDSSTISGWAMPSSRYIDLNLGSSGATYTAPANGWFDLWVHGGTTSNSKYLEIINETTGLSQGVYGTADYHYKCHLPARKGDNVTVRYANMQSAPDRCRFIYAEGDK